MTALDFMLGCVGVGVILICIAFSVKILSDIKRKPRVAQEPVMVKVSQDDQPLDPMERRLHEFRSAQFGRSMDPSVPQRPPPQTWPVTRKRGKTTK